MKINWNQNPFLTTVELDEKDKLLILKTHQAEEYENILCEIDLWIGGKIRQGQPPTLESVGEEVSKWGGICNLKTDSEEIQNIIENLNYFHGGDCICIPCSCMRCYVEDMLGINTIEGLGKHSAHKVQKAFGKDGNRTIDEVISILETPKEYIKGESWEKFSPEDFTKHIPRWQKERELGAKWLRNYKQQHGF